MENPFSDISKELFDNWLDIIWLASLCKLPFSCIKDNLLFCLFNKIKDISDKENKCKEICRELLYNMVFSNMIYELLIKYNYSGTIKIFDDYKCYLPDEYFLRVWHEINYLNDYLVNADYLETVHRHLIINDIPKFIKSIDRYKDIIGEEDFNKIVAVIIKI